MALRETIVVNVNDVAAKYEIRTLEDQIKQLGALASKAINPRFDSEGKLTGYLTTIEDKYGRILKINTEVVDKLNEQGEVIGQEDKIISSSLVINYEKMAKLAEKRAKATKEEIKAEKEREQAEKRRIDHLAELMRLRLQEAEEKKKAEAAAAKEQEQAEKRRIEHQQDLMRLRIQEAEEKKKAEDADAEAERVAKVLLAKEEELARKAEERAQKEKDISAEKERQAEYAQRQQGLNLTFANWKDWRADDGYTSRLSNSFVTSTIPTQQYIDTLTGVNREQSRINATTSMFATISDKAYGEYFARNGVVSNSIKGVGDKAEKTASKISLLNTVFLRLAHTLLSTVIRSFREAITEMKNVDSALVVVRKVSDASAEELSALKDRAYEVGAAYGVLASDYLNAAAEMTRAGYRDQAGDLAQLATKLQLVGDVSQDVANQFLIATDKSYKMNGNYKKLSETIDKLNEIDNNFATSFEKVADGIGLLAPVAAQANVSFDEMAAAIGTVTAVTQRSGTESARALRSLFLNIIRDTDTEIEDGVTWTIEEINSLSDALKKYAPEVVKAADATGELINPMEAVGALAQSYKEGLLTNQDLFDIVSGLGGKLRTSQLLALIQNWDMYNEMLEKTADAAGSADKEVQNALDSWEVKLNQLKNTFTEFVQKSLSSDLVKGLLDAAKWLIEGFGNLGTVIGLVGGALVALNITKFITLFSNFGKAITIAGGGFKGLIVTLVGYKTASKAGVVGTEEFNTALKSTSFAAAAAKVAIVGITLALTAVIFAINKANQAEEERRQRSIEAAKTAAEELREIDSLKKKYDEIKTAFEEGKSTREEYESAQDAIIQKLKDEGVWTETATEGYNTLTEAIEKNTAAAVAARKAELRGGLNDVFETLDQPMHNGLIKGDFNAVPEYILRSIYKGNLGLDWIDSESAWTYGYSADVNNIFGRGEELQEARVLQLYDALIKKRIELSEAGEGGSDLYKDINAAINLLEPNVKSALELWEEYISLLSDDEINSLRGNPIFDYLLGRNKSGESGTNTLVTETEEAESAVKGLSDELKEATIALDKYKKALEGGEKGDALKSYSDAYKKAVEMYEKGLTGSNQYMSAVDLLFGEVDDYEEAGKLLGNAFVKAMFEGGGDDYGANAANYIKKHIGDFEGVQITEGENGTFGLMVTDMDKFAESTGLTADALWTLIDALDIFDSKTTYSRDQLLNLVGLDGDGGLVDLTKLINDLAGQGKSAREIKDIVEAVKELAKTDGNITISEPEDLDKTIKDIVELNKEAEKDKGIDIVLTSNSEDFFGEIKKEIKNLDGTTIYVGIRYTSEGTTRGNQGYVPSYGRYASGTNSSRGGLSLVNEEGAEIIYANGKAWIAGGGDPTITNLPVGAGVFNAKQTREILTRSGIASNARTGAYVGGIPQFVSGGSGKAGSGKLTESLLSQIAEYINDILKKAKEALQEQLDAIDAQIDKLKREHNAEEDANKLEELRLKILEAEKKLAEAEQERTVRYFNKETGQWEWMADQKAVADAQKALQDARDAYDKEIAEQVYEAQLQALQDQKDSLNAAYNQLSGNWDKIYEELQDILNGKGEVDIAKLIEKLLGTKGGSYAPDIQTLLEAVGAFTTNPTSVLDAATTARIMSLNGTGGATSVLSAMLGAGTYDLNGNAQSTLGGNTSIVGDTIYYINGVQIGSDMMDKPLSQILSVLPIYAN